jgi:hypothetical protein
MALPNLDGKVLGDPAWTPIPANLLAGNANIYFKMVRGLDAGGVDSVMIGIMVNKLADLVPSNQIRVVLGFIFDQSSDPPPCAWRIHIQPFAGANPNQMMTLAPADVPYWRQAPPSTDNTLGWNGPEATKHQAWLTNNTKVWSYSNALGEWSLEVKLPVNLVNCNGDQSLAFPAPGTPFALYVDVLDSPTGGSGYQYPWPSTLPIEGGIFTNTPPWSEWDDFTL